MDEQQYDLAVSFAGEQRDYVARTVEACRNLGLNVFYDKDKNNDWWGSNFIRQQRTVYSSQTRFFVPFLSAEYLSKPIPMDEFSAAMMTAVKQGDAYILPVLMDNTEIPPNLMHPHIHYLRARDYTPEQLAAQLAQRVGTAKRVGQEPADIGPVVEHALAVRLPKIVPTTWSKYEELDRVFDHIATRFQQGAEQLRGQGVACSVRRQGDRLVVRVEREGVTIGGLDVSRGTQMGDDHITWSTNWRISSNSFNGWATPTFDKGSSESVIEVNDMAGMMTGNDGGARSYEAFFTLLWDRLIEQVER
jgi:TIR domain